MASRGILKILQKEHDELRGLFEDMAVIRPNTYQYEVQGSDEKGWTVYTPWGKPTSTHASRYAAEIRAERHNCLDGFDQGHWARMSTATTSTAGS